jgi:uncharacterized protein (TIGR02217 family)
MAFDEILMPTWASDITGGGPEFVTFRTTTRSGAETAVSVWNFPRSAWTLNSSAIRKTEYDQLFAFFVGRLGSANGFRFHDPRDYLIGRTAEEDEDGVITFTEAPVSTVQLTTETFQIVHPYTYGGTTVSPYVYKIVGDTLTDTAAEETDSTVRVYQADGTTEVTSGWTVNLTTGVITFSVAPGYLPKVSCEFHFMVRFDMDQLPTEYNQFLRSSSGVRLREIKHL